MRFPLPEWITVWDETGNDGFGGRTWSPPVSYPARIAYSHTKSTDASGDDFMSTMQVYSEGTTLAIGSLVAVGQLTDLTPPAAANDVRAISQTPSGAGELRKLWFA